MGFGDLDTICKNTAIPLCSLLGPVNELTGSRGIQATCYSRSFELANTVIFQGAAGFTHIIALVMTVIMIIHVRGKFTAVGECSDDVHVSLYITDSISGRREITTFFYAYLAFTVCSLLLDCGVVPPGSGAYAYFVAAQCGLASATCLCLMINGFVGFQLYEDGTKLSVWLLRACSIAMFVISFAVSILTFKGLAGLGPEKTIGLFVVVYIFNAIFLFVYAVMQILLVLGTLQERWPLAHIFFGVFFFVIGQVLLYVLGNKLCDAIQHYMDGLFFATVFDLLAVMMVYKVCSTSTMVCLSLMYEQYWDSITREDLEFSVGARPNNWEFKELLPQDDHSAHVYAESEYANSMFHMPQQRVSTFGG